MDKYVNQKKNKCFFFRETCGFLFAIFMSGDSGFRRSYFISSCERLTRPKKRSSIANASNSF
jgi:hypothetical protein